MKLQAKGRVLDVFEKNGRSYVKMNDTELGGEFKLTFEGSGPIKIDALLDLDVVVKPGMNGNNQYLTVVKILDKGGDK